jgi:hypothetical protein
MYWGMIVAIVCFVVHACSSVVYLKRIAEYGIAGGVMAIVGGMLYKQMVEHEKIIFLMVAIPFAWWALSHKRVRDWSISHILTRNNKPRPGTQDGKDSGTDDATNSKTNRLSK